MNLKYKKIKNLFFTKISPRKGIALLFAIMLSAIFLTIALGVLNISIKELNFSASAKDTANAFFAADSGVECALYNDRSDVNTFMSDTTQKIECFSNMLVLNNNFPILSFIVPKLGSDGSSCAKVTVVKNYSNTDPPQLLSTKITSKGYNVGGEDCSSFLTNQVERVLEVNY